MTAPVLRTVTRTYLDSRGQPATRGSVDVVLTNDVTINGQLAKRSPLHFEPDANGLVSMQLLCSNDPAITPAGFGYIVTERFFGVVTAYAVLVPLGSGSVNLQSLQQVSAPELPNVLVTQAMLTAAFAGAGIGPAGQAAVTTLAGLVTALQTTVGGQAPLDSPPLTGVPTAPTAPAGTNTGQLSTTAFVQLAIAALVASAPTTLDTLGEIAAQLRNDESAATALLTAVGLKAPSNNPALTGTVTINGVPLAGAPASVNGGTPSAGVTAIQLRSGTAASWTTTNPILAGGELAVETGGAVPLLKVGDGVTAWSALPYLTGAGATGPSALLFDTAGSVYDTALWS